MDVVAVLGLGAMGGRMAARLLKAGYRLQVWNRTPGAAADLVASGATLAASPRAAAAGAAFVIAMLRDDEASRRVWLDPIDGALAGLEPQAVAIESSTLSLDWIHQLGHAAQERGVRLVEAPVAGTRPQVEAGQLIYLVGGTTADWARAEPVLKCLGSAIHLVGPIGSGALAKLCVNTLLGVQVTALAELVGMLKRSGVDVEQTMKVVAATPVWSPVAARSIDSMLAGNFATQFPVELAEKDFGYVLAAAGSPAAAPTIAAAHNVFRNAQAKGLQHLNLTGVVQLFL
ncbi:NAD(P)-dependent oxidoreductase [Ensifer sp. Root142]|uniref:NAD(P)-dependent oxidoreductase n=1 Tax=unclassified Ensifer TaxID=2633371 RepID=UPI00070C330D|nr:NAD(P)-dependent oxidoreductase [Ensifer sp. Root142]KQY72520.1 3-hydroxyisobutyrate dehydrogenase [Ensifer sp. Root142]MBD9489439.1 NAD(P)-dependent oxidoreductase [Ensifer sp. ENS11]MDP9632726.1 3-hydroxyisobutyrate dehydrogenase-like beta-hydroxyacid dehydrogenase [Ensifer adhaerens]